MRFLRVAITAVLGVTGKLTGRTLNAERIAPKCMKDPGRSPTWRPVRNKLFRRCTERKRRLVSAFSGREPKNGSSDRGVPHRARWNLEPRLLNAFGRVGSAPRTNHSKATMCSCIRSPTGSPMDRGMSLGPRIRCSKCGKLGATVRPDWSERAAPRQYRPRPRAVPASQIMLR